MKIKKLFLIFVINTLCFLNTAGKFPDEMPDWKSIQSYNLANLEFGATSIQDFKKFCTDTKPVDIGNNTISFEIPLKGDQEYSAIRVGFSLNRLDWIEFYFKDSVAISDIVELYGQPDNINTVYSKNFDYYDYKFFNVATQKDHKKAISLTVFEISTDSRSYTNLLSALPDIKSFNFSRTITPGYTTESSLNDKFPGLKPVKKDKFDTGSTYFLNSKNLEKSPYYEKAALVFKNGILNFISLTPKKIIYDKIVKHYGVASKSEPAKNGGVLYEYQNFFALVDKKTGKVLNIGIFSSI
jgi:hypothetical protein